MFCDVNAYQSCSHNASEKILAENFHTAGGEDNGRKRPNLREQWRNTSYREEDQTCQPHLASSLSGKVEQEWNDRERYQHRSDKFCLDDDVLRGDDQSARVSLVIRPRDQQVIYRAKEIIEEDVTQHAENKSP